MKVRGGEAEWTLFFTITTIILFAVIWVVKVVFFRSLENDQRKLCQTVHLPAHFPASILQSQQADQGRNQTGERGKAKGQK